MKKLKLTSLLALALLFVSFISCDVESTEPVSTIDIRERKFSGNDFTYAGTKVEKFSVTYVTKGIADIEPFEPWPNNLLPFSCPAIPPSYLPPNYLTNSGTGYEVHIGSSTWDSYSWVCLGVQAGTMTFTDDSGDKLYGTYLGVGNPPVNGVIKFSGNYIITSGTGKYNDSSGKGTYSGYATLPNSGFSGQVSFTGILIGL